MSNLVKKTSHFPAKLLLFGEYSILFGGNALAFPLFQFSGNLNYQPVSAHSEALHLRLREKIVAHSSAFSDPLIRDIYRRFLDEMQQGLRFSSNVPAGYGLGSSGMLTAALYHRYVPRASGHLTELRSILAAIESVFHGQSSGLDPLVSYLSQAIFVKNQIPQLVANHSNLTVDSGFEDSLNFLKASFPFLFDSIFCLIDTGQPRVTKQMVDKFKLQMNNQAFNASFQEEHVQAQNTAIDAVLQGDTGSVFKSFKAISIWQYHNMQPMIPEGIRPYWQASLQKDDFAIKLLGAGGGGFLLGMHQNPLSYPGHSFLTDLPLWGPKNATPGKTQNTAIHPDIKKSQDSGQFPLTWL